MNKIFDYSELTLSQIIEKISTARFFHLPKMVAEAFRKLNSKPSYELPYKVYTALLTQTGEEAPIATVLENTLGEEVIWSREGIAGYIMFKDTNFIPSKTFVLLTGNASGNVVQEIVLSFECYEDTNYIAISGTAEGIYKDEILFNTPIEIRVYN